MFKHVSKLLKHHRTYATFAHCHLVHASYTSSTNTPQLTQHLFIYRQLVTGCFKPHKPINACMKTFTSPGSQKPEFDQRYCCSNPLAQWFFLLMPQITSIVNPHKILQLLVHNLGLITEWWRTNLIYVFQSTVRNIISFNQKFLDRWQIHWTPVHMGQAATPGFQTWNPHDQFQVGTSIHSECRNELTQSSSQTDKVALKCPAD